MTDLDYFVLVDYYYYFSIIFLSKPKAITVTWLIRYFFSDFYLLCVRIRELLRRGRILVNFLGCLLVGDGFDLFGWGCDRLGFAIFLLQFE